MNAMSSAVDISAGSARSAWRWPLNEVSLFGSGSAIAQAVAR
jgi:hypothetical protein